MMGSTDQCRRFPPCLEQFTFWARRYLHLMESFARLAQNLTQGQLLLLFIVMNVSVKPSKEFVHKHFCEGTNTHDAVTFLLRTSSASTLTRNLSRMLFLIYLLKGYVYDRTTD